MDGSSGPETKVHRGTATEWASPLLCTAYMSATSQYTPFAPKFLFGKRTFSFSGGAPDGSLRVFGAGSELWQLLVS